MGILLILVLVLCLWVLMIKVELEYMKYKDEKVIINERIRDLMGRMIVVEKIG